VAVPPWEVALSPGAPRGSARNALAGPINRIAGVGNRVRVTVASRPGVTQSFLVIDTGSVKPQAIALLYTGGGGRVGLRQEDGEVKYRSHNFLVRAAADFARNGLLPVVMDVPSDQNELTDDYRTGGAQSADARAVLAELKQRFAGLPVYLVGTSRGSVSAAYVARDLAREVAGVVLTSSVFGASNPKRQVPSLRGFDYAAIQSPLLFVHHRADGCEQTPYATAARLAQLECKTGTRTGTS